MMDCFNGLKTVTFRDDEEGNPLTYTGGMVSVDDEAVKWFFNDFNCVGEVEEWLYNLDIHVKLSLQGYLCDAKSTAENWDIDPEKPRDIWIDD